MLLRIKMLAHIKIFGLVINLILGGIISLYIFQVYRNKGFTFIKALAYYTLLFNISYLFLFFYSYLSINFTSEIIKQSLIKYGYLNNFFVSLLVISILFFIHNFYLGLTHKKFRSYIRWLYYSVIVFLSLIYAVRLFSLNTTFLWSDFIFDYFFENLIVLEIIFLILLIVKTPKGTFQAKLAKSFGILYMLRYVVFILLFAYLMAIGYDEKGKTILGFSFLLFLNLLPLVWIKLYFIPYTKQILIENDEDKLTAFCNKYEISQREKEILELIIAGKNNKEISNHLSISYSTVKNHIYNLFQKLKIGSRFEILTLYNHFRNSY